MESHDPTRKTCLGSLISYYVVPRRLEDRIKALSARAVSTTDPDELKKIHHQLRDLLREHVRRLRELLASPTVRTERRQAH